ncbi:MAG TPA: GNAT family N-acetyltransferase [Longimicrobiales bacterium]|nr:GNAT family N-acetyltransferase [Longimicrobiales bacterium]
MEISATHHFAIRRATPADLAALVPLFEAYRAFYQQAPDPDQVRAFLDSRLSHEESVVFVAFQDSHAIGFTQLYPTFSSLYMTRVWILNDLFVAPEARRLGVAAALMQQARSFAAQTGAIGLTLETAITNTAAQRLYERLGWQRDQQFYRYYLPL